MIIWNTSTYSSTTYIALQKCLFGSAQLYSPFEGFLLKSVELQSNLWQDSWLIPSIYDHRYKSAQAYQPQRHQCTTVSYECVVLPNLQQLQTCISSPKSSAPVLGPPLRPPCIFISTSCVGGARNGPAVTRMLHQIWKSALKNSDS